MNILQRSLLLAIFLAIFSGSLLLGITVREFTAQSGLFIVAGKDGALWFTLSGEYGLGRITPTGDFRQVGLPGSVPENAIFGIESSPNGTLWATDYAQGVILKLSTEGHLVAAFPTPGASPNLITNGPDGNLWFTEFPGGIGRLTPQGAITGFPIPTPQSKPWGITLGQDGNLWFAEKQGNKIGRITTAGKITEFPLPKPASGPLWIAPGFRNELWFTEADGNRIGRISPSGAVTEYDLPQASSIPIVIVRGPDGNLWFTEQAGRIGRISPEGVVTEFPVAAAEERLAGLVFGPDGNLWFTESSGVKVGRLTLGGTPGPCSPGDSMLCIDDAPGDRRFKVEVEYKTKQGGGFGGNGHAIPLSTLGVNRGGLFWFFSQDNPELLVKVLDGCAVNGKRWVFVSGGTNVGLIITVSDTVSGEVHTYYNLDGAPFAPVQDTAALACAEL
jgi:streptogramin lyase